MHTHTDTTADIWKRLLHVSCCPFPTNKEWSCSSRPCSFLYSLISRIVVCSMYCRWYSYLKTNCWILFCFVEFDFWGYTKSVGCTSLSTHSPDAADRRHIVFVTDSILQQSVPNFPREYSRVFLLQVFDIGNNLPNGKKCHNEGSALNT